MYGLLQLTSLLLASWLHSLQTGMMLLIFAFLFLVIMYVSWFAALRVDEMIYNERYKYALALPLIVVCLFHLLNTNQPPDIEYTNYATITEATEDLPFEPKQPASMPSGFAYNFVTVYKQNDSTTLLLPYKNEENETINLHINYVKSTFSKGDTERIVNSEHESWIQVSWSDQGLTYNLSSETVSEEQLLKIAQSIN